MRLRVNLKVEYAEFEAQAVPPHLFQSFLKILEAAGKMCPTM
jgi:hypothetical protein